MYSRASWKLEAGFGELEMEGKLERGADNYFINIFIKNIYSNEEKS